MLGTPPAFILSQDQTLEIILYTVLLGLHNFVSSFVLLFYFFVRVLFSLWNREFLALQFTISCLLLYFVLSLALIYLYMMCCSIFKDQRSEHLLCCTWCSPALTAALRAVQVSALNTRKFFFRAVLLADSLYIIPLVFTLVKGFFKLFWVFLNFFQALNLWQALRLSLSRRFSAACIWYHIKRDLSSLFWKKV